jgi:ADP-heptose:LPS heptosyltransferase
VSIRISSPGLNGDTAEGRPFPAGGRIAVVRLDGAGDVLMTGPAVRAIAARADDVTFIAGPRGAPAAALLPGVDHVEVFDAPWIPLEQTTFSTGTIQRAVDRWCRDPFDGAVVFTSEHQSSLPMALTLRLARTTRIAGIAADHPGALLDLRLRRTEGHEVRRNLTLAAAAGYVLEGDDGLRIKPVHATTRARAARGAVVIHPGASVPARGLPPGLVTGVLRALVGAGVEVVLTGTASETARFAPDLARAEDDLGGRTTLEELAATLAQASVVVVGNTGAAHLAAALRRPVVSIFAPVVPCAQWRPWTDRVTVLGDQSIGCRGCRSSVCPRPGQPCTARVTVDQVLAAVSAHLPVDAPALGRPASRRSA